MGSWEQLGEVADQASDLLGQMREWPLTLEELLTYAATIRSSFALDEPGKAAVEALLLRTVPADVIAEISGLEVGDVETYAEQLHPNAADVIRLHLDGETPLEISTATGVPRSSVYAILSRAGVEPNRQYRPMTTDGEERIRQLHADGLSLRRIAAETGYGVSQVRRVLNGST